MIDVKLFFRKPIKGFHSIEELFKIITKHITDTDFNIQSFVVSRDSTGIINRLLICWEIFKNAGQVNHVTGDIHFSVLFLPSKNTILTIHDVTSTLNKKGLRRKILWLFWVYLPLKKLKYVTVISEKTKQDLLAITNVNPEKIIVIENCYHPDFKYVEKVFNVETPTILLIGTTENKNLDRIIEVLSKIKCNVLVLGLLNEKQRHLLEENKINYKSFTGISSQQVIALYEQTDIVLFPSLSEGFGIPIIEAQASGRVLITSNISPMNDIAGKGAVFVNPYDTREIELAVKNVISNPDLRRNLVEAGLENVKKYHPETVAQKYADLYRRIYRENLNNE